MRTPLAAALPLLLAAPPPALGQDAVLPDPAAFEDKYQFDCNAPYETVARPDVVVHRGVRYELRGAEVQLRREGAPRKGPARLGVLAGIKELDEETQGSLRFFFDAFEQADVEAVIIGGDTAEQPDQLDAIYGWLVAATGRPLLSLVGNTERAGAHNYAIAKQRKAGHLQLLNLGLVRRVDAPGVDVVSLSGYHDRTYLHLSGGCLYDARALEGVERAARAADDPVVLAAHGPPRQRGQRAIDYVPAVGNVGDPQLTALVSRLKVPFGVFGHILEAAGRATDLAGQPLPAGRLHPALYLNQGSANALVWKLNDGSTSWGLGAILTVEGKKASYQVLRAPKPKVPPPAE